MSLVTELYRTNKTVIAACKTLGTSFEEDDLEDLEQCAHCNTWWHSFELMPDLDDNNICKFCERTYGR